MFPGASARQDGWRDGIAERHEWFRRGLITAEIRALDIKRFENEEYYPHLASGHIAQTFRALPGVGLDKAAKGKRQIVVPMPILRSA